MTRYELLEQHALQLGIIIDTGYLQQDDVDGLFVSFGKRWRVIYINRHRSLSERTAALAEEIGHYYQSTGSIVAMDTWFARRQELLGRAWSFERLLPQEQLEHHVRNGTDNTWDLAEVLQIPADVVTEAVTYYSHKPRRNGVKELPPEVQQLLERKLQAAEPEPPAPPPAEPAKPAEEPAKPDYTAQWNAIYQRGKDLFGFERDDRIWSILHHVWTFRTHPDRYDMVMGKRWKQYTRQQIGRFVRVIFEEYLVGPREKSGKTQK